VLVGGLGFGFLTVVVGCGTVSVIVSPAGVVPFPSADAAAIPHPASATAATTESERRIARA